MNKKMKLLKTKEATDYQIPIFLDSSYDDLGVFSYFDGDITSSEKCGITYSGNGMNVVVFAIITQKTFNDEIERLTLTVQWGDGYTNDFNLASLKNKQFPKLEHTYKSPFSYTVNVILRGSWGEVKTSRKITVPMISEFPLNFGELVFKIPYNETQTIKQRYWEDFKKLADETKHTYIVFFGFGKSRLQEFKKYGKNEDYLLTHQSTNYTGYTIDGLFYMDFQDGITQIIGRTSGNKDDFFTKNEVYNGMMTRNEHFVGFIEEPMIYSDVFIDRGRISPIEMNMKLLEIDNIGELVAYGNGFFSLKKQ